MPAANVAWVTAKKNSPSRAPYSDDELKELRIVYSPAFSSARASDATVIWTLLDMLEAQRGWEKE
jgi:hypothetical protein